MKIRAISYSGIQYKLQKQNSSKSMKSALSFKSSEFSYSDYMARQKQLEIEAEQYKNELRSKLYNSIIDDRGKQRFEIKPEIVDLIDKSTFNFVDADSNLFNGTIKDFLEKTINVNSLDCDFIGVYHATVVENIKNIIANGFDMSRISRQKFGPGIYFAFSEGVAMEYCSSKLQADIIRSDRPNGTKGKVARVNSTNYEQVYSQQVTDKIKHGIGVKNIDYLEDYNLAQAQNYTISHLLCDYCRNILVNDMNIDFAYGFEPGYEACVVVFNPDCIKNIRQY